MIKSLISKICNCGNKGKDSKLVCNCMKVTEQDIKNAIKNGANSFKEVQAITKVSTGCGKCSESNEKLVNNLILSEKINENQIVCNCMKVTVRDLDNAIKSGANSFEEVQDITKVSTGCGKCLESNKVLVAQLLTR